MKNTYIIFKLTIIFIVIGCKTSTNTNLNDDRDKDGIIDIYDKCPDQSGFLNGCPDRDSDGVPDHEDKCPDVAGPPENNGCPWPDSDGDGVIDKYDKCPDISGEDDGCPAHIPIDSVGQAPRLRKFPENPPRPSDVEVVPNAYFRNARNLNYIDIKIGNALNEAGYGRKSYYGVKDGFALVTQLEQTDRYGRPLKDDLRWSKTVDNMNGFSLSDYISSLFTAQTGYYRCIVFIVKKDPISFSSDPASEEYMEDILDNGGTSLPDEIKETAFNTTYEVTALIYQFRKPENSSAIQLSPSPTPGRHLTNSGIKQKL